VGKLEFTVTDDEQNNKIIVDVNVPRFLDTSAMDVDIHPRWFQVLVKGKLLLMHTSAEVRCL